MAPSERLDVLPGLGGSICANVGRERSYCWLAFAGYMWAITNRIAGSWWLCFGRSFEQMSAVTSRTDGSWWFLLSNDNIS